MAYRVLICALLCVGCFYAVTGDEKEPEVQVEAVPLEEQFEALRKNLTELWEFVHVLHHSIAHHLRHLHQHQQAAEDKFHHFMHHSGMDPHAGHNHGGGHEEHGEHGKSPEDGHTHDETDHGASHQDDHHHHHHDDHHDEHHHHHHHSNQSAEEEKHDHKDSHEDKHDHKDSHEDKHDHKDSHEDKHDHKDSHEEGHDHKDSGEQGEGKSDGDHRHHHHHASHHHGGGDHSGHGHDHHHDSHEPSVDLHGHGQQGGRIFYFNIPDHRGRFVKGRFSKILKLKDPTLYNFATCTVQPNNAIPEESRQPVKGHIQFWQLKTGGTLNINVYLRGFAVGKHGDHSAHSEGHFHGFHVHENGDLSDGCQSTGPHYNPTGEVHGGPTSEIRHVGDLGNIHCDNHGYTAMNFTDEIASLIGPYPIIGKSMVIHANKDDLGSNPDDPESLKTGNAGTRLACCIIKQVDSLPFTPMIESNFHFN